MDPKRIKPNIITPNKCDECPFLRRYQGTQKECWIHSSVPMGSGFRTDSKPEWCKLERIEIHDVLEEKMKK